jgi:hypothetical protein
VRLFWSGEEIGVLGLMVSIWLASGLLVRERDQGTLELLDSLPTSRVHVFLVKFAIGLLILWSGPLVQIVLGLLLHVISVDSMSGGLHLRLLGKVFFLYSAQLFVWLSLAVLFAYLRRLAWVSLALLAFLYAFLDEQVGGVAELDVLSLTDVVFTGVDIAIPWNRLAVQVPLAALCALLSGLIFCGGAERALALGTRVVATWWGRGLAVLFTLSSIALWLVVFDYAIDDGPEPEEGSHGVVYASWSNARTDTDRFAFTYPANLSGRARPLIDQAPTIDAAVRGFFAAEPLPHVEVDATGAGKSHHVAGRALWKTVQLALATVDEEEIEPVFGHELTHVYIDVLSKRKIADDFNASRFFHEGLAEYVEYRLFRDEAARQGRVLIATLAHDRERLTFALLINDRRLAAERDTLLVYPLGRLFFEVLVAAEGDTAPARILAALAREGAPKDLVGHELWRDGFQVAGLDLEAQIGRYENHLDDLVEGNRDLLASFPRLGAATSVEEDENGNEWIVLQPHYDGDLPWPVVCRIREHDSDEIDDYHFPEHSADGAFRLWRERIRGRRYKYQLGLRDPVTAGVVYERWTPAVLPR